MLASNPFTDRERQAWAPPEDLTTTEWATRYRVLSPRVTAEPGPYRADRAPYVKGIMDALSDREHQEVVVMKSVQCGGSELGRNWIGRCIDLDPGPMMIVFPTEKAAQENISERVIPMLQDSPQLRRYLTANQRDLSSRQIKTAVCDVYIGWAGSPQALASRPVRYLFLDEVDKYPGYRGLEADSISLAKDRTLTFRHRRKIYIVSTPTVPNGPIASAFQACGDRRRYHVPCPHCGVLINPEWDQVRWPEFRSVDEDTLKNTLHRLEGEEITATYQCQECKGDIGQTQWTLAVQAGQWVSEGFPPGDHPRADAVGFHITGMISPWLTLHRLSVEFTAAKLKGIAELQNFANAYLGTPFWDDYAHGDQTMAVSAQEVWEIAANGHEPELAPDWTHCIVAGADSGRDGHHVVVRAYGPDFKSRLLAYGQVPTVERLKEFVFRHWRQAGKEGLTPALRLCVDYQGSTKIKERVMRMAQKDPVHIHPVKGYGGASQLAQPTRTNLFSKLGVSATTLDVLYFKDLLAAQIKNSNWELCRGVGKDYVLQMASERRLLVERRVRAAGTKEMWRWVPRAVGTPNHYWDAEVYCLAAAYLVGVGRPEPPQNLEYKTGGRWKVGR